MAASQRGSEDEEFPFEKLPRRIFLDTNIVDCLVKWGASIFDGEEPPTDLGETLLSDVLSLRNIFFIGGRANWDIVTSHKTMAELADTRDEAHRTVLLQYGSELIQYAAANGTSDEDERYAIELARRLIDSVYLAPLPDASDRELVAHAIALRCDTFCTRDRRSILRKREQLRSIRLRIVTPDEWWAHIRPWTALWM